MFRVVFAITVCWVIPYRTYTFSYVCDIMKCHLTVSKSSPWRPRRGDPNVSRKLAVCVQFAAVVVPSVPHPPYMEIRG